MTEWWTYRLSDLILFSPQAYFRLIELYNEQVWPLQLFAAASGYVLIFLVLRRPSKTKIVSLLLAVCWLWVAWAFLLQRFAVIHWVARYYALAFAVQAAIILWRAFLHKQLSSHTLTSWHRRIGFGLLLFGCGLYPLFNISYASNWRQLELFALVPDPTVIASLGFLILSGNLRSILVVIPLAWCVVSAATLWVMKSPGFVALLIVAILVVLLLLEPVITAMWKNRLNSNKEDKKA